MEEDSGEKTEEPSQYRLEEFRSKGQVASSKELTSILVMTVSLVTLLAITNYLYEIFAEFFQWVSTQDIQNIYKDDGWYVSRNQC
jgi:flagellar biosynthetic protein FlhB